MTAITTTTPMQISPATPITAAPLAQHGHHQQPAPPGTINPSSFGFGTADINAVTSAAGISFSTNSSSSEFDNSDNEEAATDQKKRKRGRDGGDHESRIGKMMAFFEGLMRQVMDRQEAMQQRFLEALEKHEQDRIAREDAWRRQEIARLSHDHKMSAQERAATANRDAAIMSFLQKLTGQSIILPSSPPVTAPQQQQTPSPLIVVPQKEIINITHYQTPPPTTTTATSELVVVKEAQEGTIVSSGEASSSRWPKSEVHVLIKLRSGLDARYQETGPKGPLWEEISSGMQRLGYNRSAKRCKEKWENINKYFKKVKESNKKRPEDAKTCPYFHQLDALYRSKHQRQLNPNPRPISMIAEINGDEGKNSSSMMKKPEDIVKELMGRSTKGTDEHESDHVDEDDEDDENEEDDEDGKGKYRIQFQRPNVAGGGNNNNSGNGSSTATATAATTAMVR